ncbi:MAG: hypothetical protein ABIH72_01725 [archaeon]
MAEENLEEELRKLAEMGEAGDSGGGDGGGDKQRIYSKATKSEGATIVASQISFDTGRLLYEHTSKGLPYEEEKYVIIEEPVKISKELKMFKYPGYRLEILLAKKEEQEKVVCTAQKFDYTRLSLLWNLIGNASLSPDSRRLVFDVRGKNKILFPEDIKSVFIVNLDGTNLVEINHIEGIDLHSGENYNNQRWNLGIQSSFYEPEWLDNDKIQFKGRLYYPAKDACIDYRETGLSARMIEIILSGKESKIRAKVDENNEVYDAEEIEVEE